MTDRPKKLVLASGNKGKLAEFQQLFAAFGMTVSPQSDFNIASAEENGLSFVENALIKARHAAEQSGLPAIADDSGLAVDALRGAPGIYSARYAGSSASDQDNIDKLLQDLSAFPDPERSAQFHCVLAFVRFPEDPVPLIAHGQWHGKILETAAGVAGFGYDPVFWSPEWQCSAAELSREQKNAISHRGKAMQTFTKQWNQC